MYKLIKKIAKKIFYFLQSFLYRIEKIDLLINQKLHLNDYVDQNIKHSKINVIDLGCYGDVPDYWKKYKCINFYGFDIDTIEINRQKKKYNNTGKYNFFNFRITEPQNLEKFKELYRSHYYDKNFYTQRTVQAYEHEKKKNYNDQQSIINYNLVSVDIPSITIGEIITTNLVPKDINFLKIDIDSNDHEVLYGADKLIDKKELFGIQIEVDFVKNKNSNSFRDFTEVTRYLQSKKMVLCNLSTSNYSSNDLPIKYLHSFPGPNLYGCPLMGDMIFFKHLNDEYLKSLNTDQIIKLLRLLEIFNMNHLAIEVLNNIKFSNNEGIFLISRNLLIKKFEQKNFFNFNNYKKYIQNYKLDKDKFLNIL